MCRAVNLSGLIFCRWSGDKIYQSNICGLSAITCRVAWHITSHKCELVPHQEQKESSCCVIAWVLSDSIQPGVTYLKKKNQNVCLYSLNPEIRNTSLFQVFYFPRGSKGRTGPVLITYCIRLQCTLKGSRNNSYLSCSFAHVLHGYYFSGNEWYLIILGKLDLTWVFHLWFYLQIKTMYWIKKLKGIFQEHRSPKEATASSELPCS